MNLSLESLQILDAIERKGSFAGAAEELARVPSALTYTIRKLEENLDVLLFDRRGHRAKLTLAGRALLDEGRHLLQAANDLECRIKRIATGWEVELRIALEGMLPFEALTPLLQAFYAEQPVTRLRFSYEVLSGTWDAILDGRADLVIGAPDILTQARSTSGLHLRTLGQLSMVFAVAPNHPLAAIKKPLSATQIQAHRAIAVGDTTRHLPPRSVGLLSGQEVLTVPNMRAKVQAQCDGLGCGYLPAQIAHALQRAGKLVIKPTEALPGEAQMLYAWRSQNGRAAEGKALRWFLKQLEIPDVRAQLMDFGRASYWS